MRHTAFGEIGKISTSRTQADQNTTNYLSFNANMKICTGKYVSVQFTFISTGRQLMNQEFDKFI